MPTNCFLPETFYTIIFLVHRIPKVAASLFSSLPQRLLKYRTYSISTPPFLSHMLQALDNTFFNNGIVSYSFVFMLIRPTGLPSV